MIVLYAAKNIIEYISENKKYKVSEICLNLDAKYRKEWFNMGGQLIPEEDIVHLCSEINSENTNSWEEIHAVYDKLWQKYPFEKQKHAFASLKKIFQISGIDIKSLERCFNEAVKIQDKINKRVYESRKKDYDNSFRKATFRNQNEMDSVLGTIDENEFIANIQKETIEFKNKVKSVLASLEI
jgi:hypothetical protein